ncbi:MAG: hypothetical protein NZ890_13855 [Myxococcota bacterium]|nr:hypothetical protein [Myxococcota bacterium]
MADNEKKGPRDISDLKARLGLKKQPGGIPAPVPAPTGVPPAVAPPPASVPPAVRGIPAPAAVPPPPGFVPPPEPAPPPPDPRRDPFAAQQAAAAASLAAFYGVGQVLPGDASAVQAEPIRKPKPWPLIGGGIAIGVLSLGLGYASGSISVSRSDYNATTEQAARIRDEVSKIQKQVKEVALLVLSKELAQGGVNFQIIEKLRDIDLKEPEVTVKLFKTNYYSFEPSTVQQLFTYYNDVVLLARQLQRHTALTLNDRESIDKFLKASAAGGKTDKRLGVILDYSQKLPMAQLVELVTAPICPGGAADCQPQDMKLGFRTSTGGAVQTRPVKGRPQETVFPLTPTELQTQLLSGDPNLLAFEAYRRRHREIVETLARLGDVEKQLTQSLKKRAEQPKLWTLF